MNVSEIAVRLAAAQIAAGEGVFPKAAVDSAEALHAELVKRGLRLNG